MQPVSVTEQEMVGGGIDMSAFNLTLNLNVTTVAAAISQVNVNALGNAIQSNYAGLTSMFSSPMG